MRELKIDRSFVTNLLADAQDEAIVRSTIDLAHNLGLVVVAEGTEDLATVGRLDAHGCDLTQGYVIARPLDAARLGEWFDTTAYGVRRRGDAVPRAVVEVAGEAALDAATERLGRPVVVAGVPPSAAS